MKFSQMRDVVAIAERGSLRAWLYGIARKQAAEWWRRQKPADTLEIESTAP